MTLDQIHQFLRSLPVPPPSVAQSLIGALMTHPNANGVGQNTGPIYTQPGMVSAGGSFQIPGGPQVGGTLGVANGQPFGSYNVNGEVQGQFGPQGNDVAPANPMMSALDAARLNLNLTPNSNGGLQAGGLVPPAGKPANPLNFGYRKGKRR